MPLSKKAELPLAVLSIIPNPVLVKDSDLRYVWVNPAFENLFGVSCETLTGRTDGDVFKDRQAVQCTSGDIRVLQSGDVDEAYETIFVTDGKRRETITRKSRLVLNDGSQYLVGVMHDVTDVTRANEQLQAQSIELERLANTDALTGCLNRRAFFSRASERMEGSCSHWSLLALDIDHFKSVNDTHGHDAGDAVLVHFCEMVRSVIRGSDMFARLGGEEFTLLLPNTSAEASQVLAQRVCTKLAASPFVYQGQCIQITVSIGAISQAADRWSELGSVLKQADEALYKAKQNGRNRVERAA